MTNKKYNGYTNYATWRIKLEIFDDDNRYEKEVTPEQLKEECENIISNYGEIEKGLALDYALAFISDVNWYEIAESINETIKEKEEFNE